MHIKPKTTLTTASESGKRVIEQEIEGLKSLANALNAEFEAAVTQIENIKGRLIVTGMGKSGHVARKIAATLSSTGTPAYFVHPGEASHGDLGMIAREDAVLALSNSGETEELQDIVAYTRRFSIPLIALVRRASSRLADAADIGIVLPEVAEASPTGAPTTSTTMMMAFGDALAVALLERRGFTSEDFGTLHPGGKLGKAFLRVSELMHSSDNLPIVSSDTPMQEVILTMAAGHFGCAGTIDENGKLIGIITDGDLRRHMQSAILEKKAIEVMTANPITIRPTQLAVEALGIMNAKGITCLFALDAHSRPVGILHIHDCLRAGL